MKAIALISGGLDSALAARLIQGQGVEVVPLYLKIPFCHRHKKESAPDGHTPERLARHLGLALQQLDIGKEFLGLLHGPRHGFGSRLNPCIDCKILMLAKARELMPVYDASFVVTGEVLGQRPMSQHRESLARIAREAGLEGLVVRPLSARLLPETLPEKNGWVRREELLGLNGRGRSSQLELARQFGIEDFYWPAGGCLLTDPEFSRKLKDLMRHHELSLENIELLKIGRHFRLSSCTRLVVGRDEEENGIIESLAQESDYLFFPGQDVAGPTCLGRGIFDEGLLRLACRIACRYCDPQQTKSLTISYRIAQGGKEAALEVLPIEEDTLSGLRV